MRILHLSRLNSTLHCNLQRIFVFLRDYTNLFPLTMSTPKNLAIVCRSPDGELTEYPPESVPFTCVASTVMLALGIMSCSQGRSALTQLAIDFDKTQSSTWYHGFREDATRPNELVGLFLKKIAARFPLVVVDHKITDPSLLGFHLRGEWDDDFNPREQAVNLNAGVRKPFTHCLSG